MKNLLPYNGIAIDVFKLATSSKHDKLLKTKIASIEPTISSVYLKYLNAFESNALPTLTRNMTLEPFAEDLLSLYSYRSKTIRDVRSSIRNRQAMTIQTTCQYCTINAVNSMDHVLPKSEFPEFSVNPLNLFPSCTECNGYKLTTYSDCGSNIFLNLYLDPLPVVQYLFVNLNFTGGNEFEFSFYLKNENNAIPQSVFSLIESHYNKLHLLPRFKASAKELVTAIDIDVSGFISQLSVDEIVRITNSNIEKEKDAYGHNNWKCIFKSALINSSDYMARLKT